MSKNGVFSAFLQNSTMVGPFLPTCFLDRYAHRQDDTCYADFAANYKPTNADESIEHDDVGSYV